MISNSSETDISSVVTTRAARAATSEIILKTRTGRIKTTEQTLIDCECDMFDVFLQSRWTPAIDREGRRHLRLDFDHKVFTHTMMRMQTKQSSAPPSFDAARLAEQQRQLKFLCHRPTLDAEAALPEVGHAAAARIVATALKFRSPPDTALNVEEASWRELCDFTLQLERSALDFARSCKTMQAVEKLREGADVWDHAARDRRFSDFPVLSEKARESADRLLARANACCDADGKDFAMKRTYV